MTQSNKDRLKELKKGYHKTKLCKMGGSCFECCDYEGIVEDMWHYITTNFKPNK